MYDVTAQRGILVVSANHVRTEEEPTCEKKEGFAVMYYGELGGRVEGCFFKDARNQHRRATGELVMVMAGGGWRARVRAVGAQGIRGVASDTQIAVSWSVERVWQ